MINVKVFGSSSAGNCYVIDDGETRLMIEAGIRFEKVKQGLDYDLSRIAGCIISHEHQDHSKFVNQVIKATSFDVYASTGTLKAIGVTDYRGHVLKTRQSINVGSWQVTGFEVQHDAAEPMGFIFENRMGERLLFVTDTYFVRYRFKNISHMMVEMNYSKEIIEANSADGFAKILKDRILASHFEMQTSLNFIKVNLSNKLQEVWILHVSKSNGNPNLFKESVQKLTGVPVHIAGG